MSGRPKLTRREWVSTTIVGVLLLGAYVWGVWSMTDEGDDPPPSNSPGNTGRWEYDNEPPADEGDMYAPPELDCDPTGCY